MRLAACGQVEEEKQKAAEQRPVSNELSSEFRAACPEVRGDGGGGFLEGDGPEGAAGHARPADASRELADARCATGAVTK